MIVCVRQRETEFFFIEIFENSDACQRSLKNQDSIDSKDSIDNSPGPTKE